MGYRSSGHSPGTPCYAMLVRTGTLVKPPGCVLTCPRALLAERLHRRQRVLHDEAAQGGRVEDVAFEEHLRLVQRARQYEPLGAVAERRTCALRPSKV